jgi:CheY-like chemotaxis protein
MKARVSIPGVSDLGRPIGVLLVDRDAETRQLYGEFLRTFGCDVDEASDGREALAKAVSRRPDVVVTETRLQGMSGLELCRLLRRDPATRDISLVVVTGDAFRQDLKAAVTAGADAVMVKPCLPEELAAEIGRLLGRSRGLRATAADTAPDRSPATPVEAIRSEKRRALSREYQRGETSAPPTAPPVLVCPFCDQGLRYLQSYVGGVSVHYPEQWDYYECASCGTFEYRHRTRKLRRA